MVVRPKRANPISTRPIYLARVPPKTCSSPDGSPSPDDIRFFLDADVSIDVDALVAKMKDRNEASLIVAGNIITALAGRPHTEVRHAMSSLANRLAWGRIRDTTKQTIASCLCEVKWTRRRRYTGLGLSPSTRVKAPRAHRRVHVRRLGGPGGFRRPSEWAQDLVITGRRLALWDNHAMRWESVSIRGSPAVVSTATGGDDASLLDALRQRSPEARVALAVLAPGQA